MARLLLRDLTPGTAYKIQLRAVEGDSVSEWSRIFPLTVEYDVLAPDVPAWANTSPWVVSGDTFVATWTAVDKNLENNRDLSHYEIELSDGTKAFTFRTNNTSYTLTFEQNRNLFGSPKATVTARIRAVDAVGNVSAWSNTLSTTNPAPSPVNSVNVTALYDSIDFRWDAGTLPDDFQTFVVQVSTTSASSGFTTVYSGSDPFYTHPSTVYNSDHWFRVQVQDKFGSLSTAVTSSAVRPKSSFAIDSTAPDTPTSLTAAITNNANGLGSRAALTWAQATPAANDLAGFYVRYRRVGDTDWTNATFQKDDRAGIIELQAAYTNYEFQIKSYDWSNNESTWSATVTATSPANSAPGQVTGLVSVAGRDTIRYTWTPSTVADLKEYEVTFSTSSTFASNNITFQTGTAAVLDVGGLSPATTFYARVRAIDTSGAAGSWSATDTKATLNQLTPGDIGAATSANTVKTFVTEYAVNSSESTAPTTGWSTSQPTRTPGSFVWYRVVITYGNDTTNTSSPALLTGNTGASGVGISTTTVTYQTHTSSTTAPTGTWSSTPTTTTTGQFLWTRTVTTYTDNSTITAYSVAAHGATGSAGRGISSTAVTYQASSSGTTTPTGTWSTTVPAVTAGQFLWTRTIVTYTDSSTSTSYSVAGFGANGSNGISVTGVKPWFARVNTGTTPTQPANGTATPATPWQDTEPAWASGTELWRTDAISFSSGTTPTYTTQTKVATYGAIATAITAANGKNQVIFSTGDATGTADASGVAYIDGDIWYKRDTNGVVIGTWEFVVGTGWVIRTFGDATLASLNVGKLVSGDISAALIRITSTGAIQSTNYDTVAKTGWKLSAAGLDVQSGSVRASALIGDTLGSSTGKIQIAAGASIVLNGGFLRSNTYGGDVYNPSATAGWFLSDANLHIPDGNISAKALKTGTISGTNTITLSGASAIIESAGFTGAAGTGGFRLSGSGLTIPDGTFSAAKLLIQTGVNIMPPIYADFEALGYEYKTGFGATNPSPSIYQAQGSLITDVTLGDAKFNGQSLGVLYGANTVNPIFYLGKSATDYNIPVEAGRNYIFSSYVWCRGAVATNAQMRVKWSNGTISLVDSASLAANQTATGATRLQALLTVPAGVTGAVVYFESPTLTNQAGFNIDGIQVELQSSYQTTASAWSPASSTIINGGQIRTGEIRSTAYATKWDSASASYVTDNTRPAFFINVLGAAEFNSLSVRGNMIVGDSSEAPNVIDNGDGTFTQAPNGQRSTIASANYLPGGQGWILRSDGYAEFRNLVADSIDGVAVRAGTLDVNTLQNESSLDQTIWVNGQMTARNTDSASSGYGSTVSLSGAGFYVRGADSLGNPEYIVFPTSGAPNIISGSLQASTLAVNGLLDPVTGQVKGATFRGVSAVELGGEFTLNNAIVGPISAPSVTESLPHFNLTGHPTGTTGYFNSGAVHHNNELYFGYYLYAPAPVNRVYRYNDVTGQYLGYTNLPNPADSVSTKVMMSFTRHGSYWYALWLVGSLTRIIRYNSDWTVSGLEANITRLAGDYDQLTSDGTNLVYVNMNNNTTGTARNPRARKYDPNNLAVVGTDLTFTSAPPTVTSAKEGFYLNGMEAGTFDFGQYVYMVAWDIGTNSGVYVYDATGVRRTEFEFPVDTPSNGVRSFTVDKTNNYMYTRNRFDTIHEYSGQTWTTESSSWWWGYSWYRQNGRGVLAVGTTSGSTNITAAAGSFLVSDVGADISGTNIPVNARITAVAAGGASATISAAATATGSITLTVSYETAISSLANIAVRKKRRHWTVTGANGPEDTVLRFYVGRGTGTVPVYQQSTMAGGIISDWRTTATFSGSTPKSPGTFAAGSPAKIYSQQTDALAVSGITITNGSTTLVPTAANANPFFSFWVGATVTGPGIPAGTKIATYNNMNSITLSKAATATATLQTINIVRPKIDIRGDGFVRIAELVGAQTILTSESDASIAAGNKPALRVGDINGVHLRADGNEILAMSADATQGTLFLNAGGRVSLTDLNVNGVFTASIRTSLDIRTNLTGTAGGFFDQAYATAGTTTAQVNNNGRIIKSSSSRRYKKNIEPMGLELAKTVMDIEPVTYEWIDKEANGHGRFPGVIAEQAHEVGATPWVNYRNDLDEDGNLVPEGFRYGEVTAAHNLLIKELYKEIESLKERVAALTPIRGKRLDTGR